MDARLAARFAGINRIGACLCDAAIAAIVITDGSRPFVPACQGLPADIAPVRLILVPLSVTEMTVVADARADPVLARHDLVAGAPGIRFFASIPLLSGEGDRLGALLIADPRPGQPSPARIQALRDLAGSVMAELELERGIRRLRAEIAERATLADALRVSQQRMSDWVAACTDVMWETDSDLRMSAGQGPPTVTGRGFESVRGRPLIDTLESDMAGHGRFDRLTADMQARRRFRGFEFSRMVDGTRMWLEINGVPYFSADGIFLGYRGVTRNITRRKLAEAQVERLAQEDYLTGLPNRREFHVRLEDQLARATPAALLMIDLDHFKAINDTLGHDAGDALLREAARRLAACLRDGDCVARFGGDEFMILLAAPADRAAVRGVMARVMQRLKHPMEIDGHKVRPNATIGAALLPQDGATPDSAMKAADVALYRAKHHRRGTWCFYGDAPPT